MNLSQQGKGNAGKTGKTGKGTEEEEPIPLTPGLIPKRGFGKR
jgi:hypothetical protein